MGLYKLRGLMSQSKNKPEEAVEEPSGIEIVTISSKNGVTQEKKKDEPEPEINVIAPAEDNKQESIKDEAEEQPPAHSHLGDKEGEEKLREHVKEVRQEEQKPEQARPEGEEPQQEEDGSEIVSQSNLDVDDKSAQSQKSQKSYRSQRSRRRRGCERSNYESNEERREDLPSSRKCFNRLCTSKKIYKKIRSRVQQNKYRFFCRSCYDNYYNNLYCQFCEQIYSTNGENEDDDKWIGCDHCDRWNHTECERKYRDRNINELKDKNMPYDCLVCSQKTKAQGGKGKKVEKDVEDKTVAKQKIEINRDNRTMIFHKKIENFPNLEYFLQNYSFRLWMNEGQIREDIEHLRNTCLKVPPEEGSKSKFKKVKID